MLTESVRVGLRQLARKAKRYNWGTKSESVQDALSWISDFLLLTEPEEIECQHTTGFRYTGTIPCTGPLVCIDCGKRIEDCKGSLK